MKVISSIMLGENACDNCYDPHVMLGRRRLWNTVECGGFRTGLWHRRCSTGLTREDQLCTPFQRHLYKTAVDYKKNQHGNPQRHPHQHSHQNCSGWRPYSDSWAKKGKTLCSFYVVNGSFETILRHARTKLERRP